MCYTRSRIAIAVMGVHMTQQGDELREFMMVLRRALLMIVLYIEKRYSIQPDDHK